MQLSARTRRLIGRGDIPTIACFNRSTAGLGSSFDALIRGLQSYVARHVAPIWGTHVRLVRSHTFVAGQWALVFLDDADAPGSLAYHDLTPDGLPQGKVFVRTAQQEGQLVSVVASHELVEMLVDPGLNMLSAGPEPGSAYAYEVADPVQSLSFSVRGLLMSDFVYPAYFQAFRPAGSVPFDHLRAVNAPFQLLPGGYQTVITNEGFTRLFGSADADGRFARKSMAGRRSERRALVALQRSDVPTVDLAA